MRGSTAGITDGLRGTSRVHNAILTLLDFFLASILISPLVVSYWRGTWQLMDTYVYSDSKPKSSFVSLGIGLIGIFILTHSQKCYNKILNPEKHRLIYYIVSRIYTAFFGFACVNSWRGAWMFVDIYTGTTTASVVLVTSVSLLILACTRTLRNISAPPFAIATDRYEGYFEVPTMFKTSSGDRWIYILDCGFSVFVVGTLVVFVWRGAWTILDKYLFPETTISAWVSLAIGYGLVLASFAAQPLMKKLVTLVTGFRRLLIVDLYLIFAFCGTVNVWRGVWGLLDMYFLPDNKTLSYWLTHGVSFLFLVLINASNSVLVRGVYIDAEEEGEQCVDFPCYYLRLFFQEKRKKKLLKQMQKKQVESLSRRKSEADGVINKEVPTESPENQRRQSLQIMLNSNREQIV